MILVYKLLYRCMRIGAQLGYSDDAESIYNLFKYLKLDPDGNKAIILFSDILFSGNIEKFKELTLYYIPEEQNDTFDADLALLFRRHEIIGWEELANKVIVTSTDPSARSTADFILSLPPEED